MPAGEKELSQRFADYSDEALLRILTADRAKYRPDALELAGRELSHRGLSLPLMTFAEPSPVQVVPHADDDDEDEEQPNSPYQPLDLLFDAALCFFAIWAAVKLNHWTEALGGFWGTVIFWGAFAGLVSSMTSLRKRWRAKQWRD